MRTAWLLRFVPATLIIASLAACGGDDGVMTDTTASTTAPPGTSSGPGTTGTTGTTGNTSVEPTTGDLVTSTSTTTTTTDPATSTTTVDPGTTSETTSETTSDDTGPVVPGECTNDADCKLFEDCCECSGVPVDEDKPICKLGCDVTQCAALDVDQAVCRLGQCITERLDCDTRSILCLALPPECPPGTLPGVDGECWSGKCVPPEICNVVPDCDLCPDTWMCVTKVANAPQNPHTCEPIPEACAGEPSCECAGEAVCTDSFTFCSEPGGNSLDCECISC